MTLCEVGDGGDHIMRRLSAAIGLMILALSISCSGVSAQDNGEKRPSANDFVGMPPPADEDRMGCEASLQAYNQQGCDETCSDECKSIGSDLSQCKNIGDRQTIACKE